MQTPDTPRGRETERLMLLWRKQNPEAEASAYNCEWDSVYRKLEGAFSDKEDGRGSAFAKAFEEEFIRLTEESLAVEHVQSLVADHPPKPRPAKRVRPATKGAFGKPKHLRRR
jgi:hypothetical protein